MMAATAVARLAGGGGKYSLETPSLRLRTGRCKLLFVQRTARAFPPSAPATGCCSAAMASLVAASTVQHTTLAQRPLTNPAALTAAMPRVLLREGQRPEWDTYLHALYGEHP